MARTAAKASSVVVSDALWSRIEALIPKRKNTHRFGGGRPRRPDRDCVNGILFALRTGCQWRALDVTGFCPGSTAHDRFQEWAQAGVFWQLWCAGLMEYDELKGIDWKWAIADGAMTKAPLAGDCLEQAQRRSAHGVNQMSHKTRVLFLLGIVLASAMLAMMIDRVFAKGRISFWLFEPAPQFAVGGRRLQDRLNNKLSLTVDLYGGRRFILRPGTKEYSSLLQQLNTEFLAVDDYEAMVRERRSLNRVVEISQDGKLVIRVHFAPFVEVLRSDGRMEYCRTVGNRPFNAIESLFPLNDPTSSTR